MRPIDADYLNMYLCELQMANLGEDDDYCETLNEVIHIVDEQPTIEAAPVKHGEWINESSIREYKFICSACGEIFFSAGIESFRFCPICGAKMDGERKET